MKNKQGRKWVCLLPVSGALLFTSLYVVAAFYYPGGSQHNPGATGFSWIYNYWCNLLNEHAINGQLNPARPIALAAMLVLCITLAVFWYLFPYVTGLTKPLRLIMQMAGSLSMISGFFLFTNQHDIVVNIASFFGLVATIITLIRLYQLRWNRLFRLGLFNTGLVLLNNILYYGNDLRYYLPVVQKISFLFFLSWISITSIHLYREQVNKSHKPG